MKVIANYQQLCFQCISAGVTTPDPFPLVNNDGRRDPDGDYVEVDVSVNPDGTWGWAGIKPPADYFFPNH